MTKLCIKILVKADSAIESAFPLYFKIFFHIVHEDLDRRRLEHGLLEDEMARAQDRTLLAVVDHFAIDIRRTLREKICRNERLAEAMIHDFYAGQAVRYGQKEMRRFREILTPPAASQLIQRRVTAITDGRLVRQGIIVDLLCRDEIERRILEKDIRIRPFLIAADDGEMDIFLLDQLRQAVTRVRRERDLDVIVLIDKALQNGWHVRLREGLARTDAQHAGNGIRLMCHEVLHILILLQFFFGKGEETIPRIGEMDALIGADEKRTADFFFHLAQAIRQRRLGHKQPLGNLIDAAFFSKIDQNLPIRVIHGTSPCAVCAPT